MPPACPRIDAIGAALRILLHHSTTFITHPHGLTVEGAAAAVRPRSSLANWCFWVSHTNRPLANFPTGVHGVIRSATVCHVLSEHQVTCLGAVVLRARLC